MGRVEEVPHTGAISVVQATSSLASSGSALPQQKIKLAHKLLSVSSRITRVLVLLSNKVVDIDLSIFIFLAGGVRAEEQPAPGRLRADRSERASEKGLVREGYSPEEE